MRALLALLLFSARVFFLAAQPVSDTVAPTDSIDPRKGQPKEQLREIKDEKEQLKDSAGNEPPPHEAVDTTLYNKYGDLLDDDSAYHRRYPLWIPLFETICINGIVWSIDKYYMNAEFAQISPETWKENLKLGWEWDVDRFGVNFIGHPYSGNLYYNAGRSNGYSFGPSLFIAVGGSLVWEYFGENTRPSYNDIINTPVSGAFFGEIFYRLSSNILDDRTTGFERVSREVAAGLINPVRGINRMLQGKTFRRTNREVYQKEPLNVFVFAGAHKINETLTPELKEGSTSFLFNVQFDYGNPFEIRSRKPYDFFKLRAEFDFGVGRKILSNVSGYGILGGRTNRYGKHSVLFGAFQYYDYYDNNTFELGALAFGGGMISNLQLSKKSNLYTRIHAGIVPFSGNSTHFGPDTASEFRDYNFGGGLEGKLEATLNFSDHVSASLVYEYYFIRTYEGIPGDNRVGIFRPRLTVRLLRGLSIGGEYFVYYNQRQLENFIPIESRRSEQKIFLLYYFEDNQRRGRYH